MSERLLELREVQASYSGGEDVLRGVSFSLKRGEILALVGESGCGKSTALKAVMGLPSSGVRVASGSVVFDGHDMVSLSEKLRRRLLGEELCMVFQDPATSMNPIRKVRRQFLETIKSHRRVGKKEALEMIGRSFARLGLPDSERILNSCPFELSGGMCQRVALALATVMEPKLILADEPTSALDVVSQLQVIDELSLLREKYGTSVILVTHNIAVAARVADRIGIMLDGRIVECRETKKLLLAPEHEYTKKLLADVPELRTDGAGNESAGCLLRAESVSRSYRVNGAGGRELLALEDVSFSLAPGEVLGIVGESGSGKSTLARQLMRLERPDSGRIEFEGLDIGTLKRRELRRFYREEQMVFQIPVASFSPRKTIYSSIRDSIKNLTDIRSEPEIRRYVDELMERVGLPLELADRYPFELSGGQCQRAAIARAIAPRPKLLICDEATSALDVTVQARIVELLRSLTQELDMSMIFISHDIALVSHICNRVLVMKNGRCVEYGETGELIASPKSAYTRSLLDAAGLL